MKGRRLIEVGLQVAKGNIFGLVVWSWRVVCGLEVLVGLAIVRSVKEFNINITFLCELLNSCHHVGARRLPQGWFLFDRVRLKRFLVLKLLLHRSIRFLT